MKNTSFFAIVFLSVLTLSFNACEKSDNDDEREANASLVFDENGTQITSWENNINFATEYDNGYHIQWLSWDENSDRVIYLELGHPAEPYDLVTGTFLDNTPMASISYEKDGVKYNAVDDGVITITSVDKGNKTISGNFEFNINTTVLGEAVVIDASGEFTSFPY
jgi:hypothetical protein